MTLRPPVIPYPNKAVLGLVVFLNLVLIGCVVVAMAHACGGC